MWTGRGKKQLCQLTVSVCPNLQFAMDITTEVESAHAAGSKDSPYSTRDKLWEEHSVTVHAHRAKKVVKAADSAGCANIQRNTKSQEPSPLRTF